MRASATADGRVRLVLPFSKLLFLQWALWTTVTALDQQERWFGEVSGLSPARALSLDDEITAVRYALEGRQSPDDPRARETDPSAEPRKADAAWDALPRIEAEALPDRLVALTLPREKLAVFPSVLEASVVYVAPRRSEPEQRSFHLRFAASTEEAQQLADELRRLHWRARPEGTN